MHLHLPFAVKKRGQKIHISWGLSVNDFQSDWRSDERYDCCVLWRFFFFFFALTSHFIVCRKVQKNYTANTFSTRLPDKRSGPQEETALNKVKCSRWPTFQNVSKEAGIQSNLSVVFRICSSHLLSAADWGGTRTTLQQDYIQPTVVWISPEEQIKINFYSTSPEHLIWFNFISTQWWFLLLANWHTYLLFLCICGTDEGWADRYCRTDTAILKSTHLVMTP